MYIVQVTNLALHSELFLCTWRHAAGFTIRHYLPDYLLLCGATFHTTSCVNCHTKIWNVFFFKKIQMEANIKKSASAQLQPTACPSKIL